MSDSSSTALTRIETVPNNGMLASVLRRLLAWLDSRNTIVVTLPAPVTPEPEHSSVPDPEDDGMMKPDDMIRAAGNLLWAHRSEIEITLDIDETKVDRQMHSEHHPVATVRLPGGLNLLMPANYSAGAVIAPDGHRQAFDNQDDAIMDAWRSIQIQAVVDTLGLEDLMERPADDDGEIPHKSHRMTLSRAIGKLVESRSSQKSTCKYLHHHSYRKSVGRDDYTYEHKDIEVESPWLEIGEGVLLRLINEVNDPYQRPEKSHALLKHPHIGQLTLAYAPIAEGLERRRVASLTAALGIARELPVHLPMPRGNALAARVLRLCREAIAAEPDLIDAAGTPIRPLVDKHLPELMRRHAAASAIAPESELAGIDADLMTGIDRVKKAVEEALSCSAVARRSALKAQLGFLELRHPDPVPLLECIPTSLAA